MIRDTQLVTFVVASLCVAIFLASFASAGFRYRREHLEAGALFGIWIVLVLVNTLLTMHFLVLAFSFVIALAALALAAILKIVYGMPITASVATTVPVPERP